MQPILETSIGKFRGSMVRSVCVFRGLRYGQTTAGANRFLPPKPPAPSAGIVDAAEWGDSAPQAILPGSSNPFFNWYAATRAQSEDCLSLNVFTPGIDSKKRPVMVWMHGGGWRNYASTAPGFDATLLARAQDLVVVSLNHRLNLFGFIRLETSDERFADSGNSGLLDIVLALKWVRENAAAFGGDPGNVTIFGQSGGAAKVAALLAMPAAKGLFHKAIVQSTSGGMRIAGAAEASAMTTALLHQIGRPDASVEDLQRLPAQTLIAGMEKTNGQFRPVIDQRNFAHDPYFPKAPEISGQIPLMVGTTNTETTWYLCTNERNYDLDIDTVKRRLCRFLNKNRNSIDHIVEAYRSVYPEANASDLLIHVTTDYLFKRNNLKIAELHAALGAPVYSYVFARESPVQAGRMRSPHSSELPFIFGATAAAAPLIGDESASDIKTMTDLMMATWASFARTGSPENPALPEWLPFKGRQRHTMILQQESRLANDPGGLARAALDGIDYYEYSHNRSTFTSD